MPQGEQALLSLGQLLAHFLHLNVLEDPILAKGPQQVVESSSGCPNLLGGVENGLRVPETCICQGEQVGAHHYISYEEVIALSK